MEESCSATFGNMSRVGNNVITIPEGVKIENNAQHLLVTGPNGNLSVDIDFVIYPSPKLLFLK